MIQVSEAVENQMRILRIGCVDHSASVGKSTRPGGLCQLEVAGILAGMRPRVLGLVFDYVHGISDGAKGRLVEHVYHEHLPKCDWFEAGKMMDQAYRKKLFSLVAVSVDRVLGREGCAAIRAGRVGVNRPNYYKTWADRENELYSKICQWYYDAEEVAIGKASRQFCGAAV